MENNTVPADPPLESQPETDTVIRAALKGFRKFLLQFLLPVLAVGPLLVGAEKVAELLGFHGSDAQFIRIIMMAVYALIIFKMVNSGKKKA